MRARGDSPSRALSAFKRGRQAKSAEGTWLDLTLLTLTFYISWLQRRGGSYWQTLENMACVRDERRDPVKEAEKEPRSHRRTNMTL